MINRTQTRGRWFLSIFAPLTLFLTLAATPAGEEIKPDKHHSVVAREMSNFLVHYHYNRQTLSDSLSSVMFDNFIAGLDPNRYYFYGSDIETFERFRYRLDDMLKAGNLEPAYLIFNIFKERVSERVAFVEERLAGEFDFSRDENFYYDRENASWATSLEDINDLWRKRIKHDALNLKLAGKDNAGIAKTLGKRYSNLQRTFNQFDAEDVFEVFMNAFSEAFDPHTNYYSPVHAENFQIRMSLSLEGIGARLSPDGEYTNVAEVVPGGPADKQGELQKDDKIVGVAQGDEGEMVDVIGWKLDDVVQLIRGKKGTLVRLDVLPAGNEEAGTTKIIHIIRDKVKLEDRAAKSDTLHIRSEGREYVLGVIDIPAFYSDTDAQNRGDRDFKSTTRDVRNLIRSLQGQGVDGIIIDLRNNGGGSLNEAIEMTGLFIPNGPVVQVRESSGKVRVYRDPDPKTLYTGPLAVMINRFSASASEIFAAAIQDYQRGVIVGHQSFGKGTVQHYLSLQRVAPQVKERLGHVKMTIQKFYRINGGSTQSMGVVPDINFPSAYDISEYGENSQKRALPWDKISPTRFKKYGNLREFLPQIDARHKSRAAQNPEFKYIIEDLGHSNEARSRNFVSLQEAQRKQERETREARRLKRINERRVAKGLKPLAKDDDIPKDDDARDPLLDETGWILVDMISMSKDGLSAYFR